MKHTIWHLVLLGLLAAPCLSAQIAPQVAVGSGEGGVWRTTLVLAARMGSGIAELSFFDVEGTPMPVAMGGRESAVHEFRFNAGTIVFLELRDDVSPLRQGWLRIRPADQLVISGQTIFRQIVPGRPDFESSVPLAPLRSAVECIVPLPSPAASAIEYPYDNTAGFASTMALLNLAGTEREFAVEILSEEGTIVETGTVRLGANSQRAFRLDTRFPSTTSRRGLVRVMGAKTEVAIVALRFNDSGPFATLSPLTQ